MKLIDSTVANKFSAIFSKLNLVKLVWQIFYLLNTCALCLSI